MKSKPLTVLEALLFGQRLKMDDAEYVMSDDYDICLVSKKYSFRDMQHEEVYLKTDMTIASFIKWAEKFSTEQLFLLGAERVLQKINSKKYDINKG